MKSGVNHIWFQIQFSSFIKEIPKLKNKIESVQLCFTTDPFMYEYDEIAEMSLEAIHLLNVYGIRCTVLTKGLLPIELADKKKYPLDNEYGITLISLDEAYREKMEPVAAPYTERLEAVSFTDRIIFGRTNYCTEVTKGYPQHKNFTTKRHKK